MFLFKIERLNKSTSISNLWNKIEVGLISRESAEDACEVAEALIDALMSLEKLNDNKNYIIEDIFNFDFKSHFE